MPLDRFGREIDYLRISLTDHCNLRCVYCMPLEGITYAPSEDLLQPAEIERVAAAAAAVGFRRVRLTGGEPTLRRDIVEIVARIASVEGIADIAMTTNGLRLPELGRPLVAAGLRRVNLHIDSLHPERLPQVMRWATLAAVHAGIAAAEDAGLSPIKINSVMTRGHNEEDAVDLAALTLARPWHVRFIELMPLGGGECAQLSRERLVPTAETRARIEAALGRLTPVPAMHPSDEARLFKLAGAAGIVGFISPVSEPFCGTCNRMRLTADGRFHLCLLHDDELDVRAALRRGADCEEIGGILLRAVGAKPTGHALAEGVEPLQRWMHHVGG